MRDGARIMSGAGTIYADEWLSYLHSYGFYLQDNFGWRNRYFLDLGMRVDYNTAFGDKVAWQAYPKVGLSYVASTSRRPGGTSSLCSATSPYAGHTYIR